MKIAGRRRDGALYLTLGGGLAVMLKGTRVTPTLDESVIESMGPWVSTPDDNVFKTRQATKVALDLARVASLPYFTLDKDEHGYGSFPRNEASIPGVSKPPGPASSTRRADDEERAADVDAALARPARDADARPARDADARPAKDADARPAGDRARDEARFAAEDRRKAMDRRKAEREEGWTANSPEGRNTRRDIAGGLKKRLAKNAKALEYTKSRMAELHALSEDLSDDEFDLMLDCVASDCETFTLDKDEGGHGSFPKDERDSGGGDDSEAKGGLFGKLKKALGFEKKPEKELTPEQRLAQPMTPEEKAAQKAAHKKADEARPALPAGATEETERRRKQTPEEYQAESDADTARMKADVERMKEARKKRGGGSRVRTIFGSNDPVDLGAAPGGLFVKKTPVALDDTPPDEKKAVSEHAETAQKGEAMAPAPKEEVLNLPSDEAAPDAVAAETEAAPNPFFPADDRKQRREKMRTKIAEKVKSQGKVGGLLGDEEVSDDDLFAMAKELGMDPTARMDNAARYRVLLASTTFAKHISLAGGEHPFQYCIDNVVPSMEDEGKGPDDPEAFCAWWKSEHGE